MSKESLEERKAQVLIKNRKYKLLKKANDKEITSYLVSTQKPKSTILIWCIPNEGTVGIALVKRMEKTMINTNVEQGIMITRGRYTHSARKNATIKNIELLPRTFPAFDLFKHKLVPKHEILTQDEREQLLKEFKLDPYQLPQITALDPAVKAIGAEPGDILRVIRESATAGTHLGYRYVIE